MIHVHADRNGDSLTFPFPATGAGTVRQFETGMQRSGDADHLAFDLIHPLMLLSLAKTLAEGAAKHGRRNWELGSSVGDNLNHTLRHICLYLAGDRSEPHLHHAFCDLGFAVVEDTLRPTANEKELRGPGCRVTAAMIEHLEAGRPERERRRAAGEFDRLGEWKLSEVPEVTRILAQRSDA